MFAVQIKKAYRGANRASKLNRLVGAPSTANTSTIYRTLAAISAKAIVVRRQEKGKFK